MFETPILFLIFNRPDTTKVVFDEIKKQKPKYLFIAADGARSNVIQDAKKCKITRDLVLEGIDWDCEVKTLFRDENLGCGLAVSQAITWFFDNVEQGIILEDDCLPHPSFFNYCHELLEKYKENQNIFAINGSNLLQGKKVGDASYFFSDYVFVWGWASWRRAWQHYDFDFKHLENFKVNNLIKRIDDRTVFKKYWIPIFEKVLNKEIDTWDYQWSFSIWNNQGIVIAPNTNLISNMGFGVNATHTTGQSPFENLSTQDIGKIIHPKNIKVDKTADRYISDNCFKIIKNKKRIQHSLQAFGKKIFKYLNK
ncbi:MULTISPECIES: hypothetical protein [unclassified Flavobacterium]|uniref:hypothetical protein n=1 Tax=unclassified Flavobacterium TaxID=196869 RepID=UPI0006ABC89A|nr:MULTISPECIES: hypothetical protein [unclassified Flavobacterium]KOP39509.1 nucleotide-diphospho-sugar transferase [Flavobacterium sp. VMW]OWU91795.1 nucleotide-diphospho-sugar transferase [Flavobacterium sp. NLM]